jgi:hypothetical protein
MRRTQSDEPISYNNMLDMKVADDECLSEEVGLCIEKATEHFGCYRLPWTWRLVVQYSNIGLQTTHTCGAHGVD